jgi:MoxR-like ATPase
MNAPAMTGTKVCRRCLNTKDVSAFGRKASQPDGRSIYCVACTRAMRVNRPARPTVAHRANRVADPVRVAPTSAPPRTDAVGYIVPRDVAAVWSAVTGIADAGGIAPNMVFVGPSGSGKTECAKELARRTDLPFFAVDAPSMTDPEAWFGTREVVVEDGAPVTVYRPSTFVAALQQPCVLLVDEFNRVADAVRQIMLALWDDSRSVTNPLTGERVVRHPRCFIIATGNVGLAFTGTYAVDVAFTTRALTSHFDYLAPRDEERVVASRTGCTPDVAALFVRFATETRDRARNDPDFAPISTREVITAATLVAVGLDVTIAARQAIINAASDEGGGDSHRSALEMIWTGIRPQS